MRMTRRDSRKELQPVPPCEWPDSVLPVGEEWPLDTSLDGKVVYQRDVHCPNPKCNSYCLSHAAKTKPLPGGNTGERSHQQRCLACGFTFQVVTQRPTVRIPYWQIEEE